MRRRTFIGAVVAAGSALAGRFPAFAQSDGQVATPATGGTDMANAHVMSGYAPVNGLQMYYEIHGTGEPLVLLHGGVAASDIFDPLLPMFAESRQVITVDLQAHGRTRDIDRPLRYEAMADDIAALIAHLGLRQADLMGYSMGGGVALQTAIRHPELVDRLVVVSMTMKRDGSYPEVLSVFD